MKNFQEKLEKRWLKRITKWAVKNGIHRVEEDTWAGVYHRLEVRFVDSAGRGFPPDEVHFNLTQGGTTLIGIVAPLLNEESMDSLFGKAFKEECLILADDGLYYSAKNIESVFCVLESESDRFFTIHNYTINTTSGSPTINGFLRQNKYLSRSLSVKRDFNHVQDFPKGKYEKDLFWPVKKGINGYFFGDDYRIRDFYVLDAIEGL